MKQVTVFLSNEHGRLLGMTEALANAGVNQRALVIADTAEYGVARLLCDAPERAVHALNQAGYRARLVDVIGVRVSDEAGGLAPALRALSEADVNIEYLYCISVGQGHALDVVKADDRDRAAAALRAAGFQLVDDMATIDEG
ncbi:amino acid-binding protein [Eggerthellaceae bacterium zg-1084]|uniref:amino acid-binding protein n=1 Tax=Berryella wangjianweii TaxID=2734634 RepID=UPI001551DAB4|nr:amino acid-binding protein [Berryella wangjianweii]NPD30273.1 amino acid-binding protein [Berryella wangjianweii]NPD32576.1 amino acid-binding protein [Eggerthellaceae bacterium zg-997]